MNTHASYLSARELTKRYGELLALDQVSLDIAAGEFFGLLGPNGAGKSTFMSLVAGLKSPDTGTITLGGESLRASARNKLGFVPQGLALYPKLNAHENLAIFGALQGLSGKDLYTRVDEMLTAVQLRDRAREPVQNFSGGMQRRLNLAAALLHRPSLLLCDEPTVGVDPQSRNAIFDLLEQLNRDGLTIIYSTHYLEEATRLCSRIAVIDHGKILASGTLDDLLAKLSFQDEIRFPLNEQTRLLAAQLVANGEVISTEEGFRFRPASSFPLSQFYQLVEAQNLSARLINHQRPTLEAVFLQLTGRGLRE